MTCLLNSIFQKNQFTKEIRNKIGAKIAREEGDSEYILKQSAYEYDKGDADFIKGTHFIQNQKKKSQNLESYLEHKSRRKNQQEQIQDKKRNRILLEIKKHKEMLADKERQKEKEANIDKRRKQFHDKNKAIIRTMLQARKKKKKKKKKDMQISERSKLEENRDVAGRQTFETLDSQLVNKLRMAIKSPVSNLRPNEKKGALEWLDFRINAAILKKTDKAIKEKMERKQNVLEIDDEQQSDISQYESYDEYGYDETGETDYDIYFK